MKVNNIVLALAIMFVLTLSTVSLVQSDDVDAADTNEGVCGDNARWSIRGDTLYITGSGEIGRPAIPDTGYTHVIVGEGITSFGYGAFSDCQAETIQMPESLVYTGYSAFNASMFRELVFPESVETIEEIGYMPNLERIYAPGAKILGYLLDSDIQVTEKGLGEIRSCPELKTVELPNLERIGHCFGFANCPNLTHLDLSTATIAHDRVAETGFGMNLWNFSGTPIQELDISGLTTIPRNAFSGLESLQSVALGDNLESIGESAFFKTGLITVEVPDGVKMGFGVFFGCKNLESAIIGNVGAIPECCFDECNNLVNVTLSEGITSLGGQAFHSCLSLESIAIPRSVTSIGYVCFSGCVNLKEIYIYGNPDIADGGNKAFALSMGETYTTVYTDNPGILDGKGNRTNHWNYVDITADPDRDYYILFMNGETIYAEYSQKIGEIITAPEGTPTKSSDSRGSYVFDSWGGYREGITVTGNMTFDAVYTLIPIESVEDDVSDDSRYDMGGDGFAITPDIKDEQDQMIDNGITSGVIFINGRMSVMFDAEAWEKIPAGGATITLRQAGSTEAPFSVDGAVAWFEIAIGDIHDFSPGNVIITLPIPAVNDGMEYTIATVGLDGQVEELEGNITGDLISFGTDHLSYFAIVESEDTVLIPSSGADGIPLILIIGVVVLLLVVVVVLVVIRKKHRSV